jgi:hypothetical protein
MPQSPAKPAAPANKPQAMSPAGKANTNPQGKEPGLKPIQAPLLPISAAQQAQLRFLLSQYKANQITPEAYHQKRAAILAQP